jgi:hypothetical protein
MTTKKPNAAEITEALIASWKEQFGYLTAYKTADGKVAYFREPTIDELEASTAVANQGKPIRSNQVLAKATFLGGDEAILEDKKYLLPLGKQLQKIQSQVEGEFTEL